MTGVLLATQGWGVVIARTGEPRALVPFALTDPDSGDPIQIYADRELTVPYTARLQTQANGTLPGWVAPGSYMLEVLGTSQQVEAVTGGLDDRYVPHDGVIDGGAL